VAVGEARAGGWVPQPCRNRAAPPRPASGIVGVFYAVDLYCLLFGARLLLGGL
jgi:hypothetical protein